MIAEQKELEKTFQNLIEQQQALRGVVNQSKLKENSREVREIVGDAHTSDISQLWGRGTYGESRSQRWRLTVCPGSFSTVSVPAARPLFTWPLRRARTLQVKMVSDALRESTAKLCRNLKSTPNVVDNISKVMQQRLYLQDLFNR